MYKIGQKVYFQINPMWEDTNWYPGIISGLPDESKCYQIMIPDYWRRFYAPETRLKERSDELDEFMVWKQLWEEENHRPVPDTRRGNKGN